MTLDGRKFSGSAFEVDLGGKKHQTKVLHHGTLLLNVDLEGMVDYLSPSVAKLKSKVASLGHRQRQSSGDQPQRAVP